jgi:hypothetical protein
MYMGHHQESESDQAASAINQIEILQMNLTRTSIPNGEELEGQGQAEGLKQQRPWISRKGPL